MRRRRPDPGLWMPLTARMLLAALLLGAGTAVAQAQATIKIVGVGATTCSEFNDETSRNPASERDYVAWAQGFMSGLLIRAPAGVDEMLDLLPQSLPLAKQTDFLRTFCRSNPGKDFTDAVTDLYRLLRKPSS